MEIQSVNFSSQFDENIKNAIAIMEESDSDLKELDGLFSSYAISKKDNFEGYRIFHIFPGKDLGVKEEKLFLLIKK